MLAEISFFCHFLQINTEKDKIFIWRLRVRGKGEVNCHLARGRHKPSAHTQKKPNLRTAQKHRPISCNGCVLKHVVVLSMAKLHKNVYSVHLSSLRI